MGTGQVSLAVGSRVARRGWVLFENYMAAEHYIACTAVTWLDIGRIIIIFFFFYLVVVVVIVVIIIIKRL